MNSSCNQDVITDSRCPCPQCESASGSGGTSYQSVPRTDGSVLFSPLPTPVPPPEEHQSILDPWMSDLQDILVLELIAAAKEAEAMDRAQSRAIP